MAKEQNTMDHFTSIVPRATSLSLSFAFDFRFILSYFVNLFQEFLKINIVVTLCEVFVLSLAIFVSLS